MNRPIAYLIFLEPLSASHFHHNGRLDHYSTELLSLRPFKPSQLRLHPLTPRRHHLHHPLRHRDNRSSRPVCPLPPLVATRFRPWRHRRASRLDSPDMGLPMRLQRSCFQNPNLNPHLQPALFAAGIYIILGYIIHIFGPHTSPLTAKQYLWVFCTIDFFSLLLQAIGGGMASAAGSEPNGNVKPGTDTMIAGIVFQLVSNFVFACLFASVLAKTYQTGKGILNVDNPSSSQAERPATTTKRLRILAGATTISTLALIARGVYRSIELIQGWRGYLITTERYFIGLDGALMVIAVSVFVFANPHWLLPHKARCTESNLENASQEAVVEKVADIQGGSESE